MQQPSSSARTLPTASTSPMRQMKPTILLFDIDGTLISTHGAGRRAFARAFDELTGPGDHLDFSFAGMTDRGIARQGLAAAGIEPTEAMIDRVLDTYVGWLGETLQATPQYTVFTGVVDVLESLRDRAGVAVGLGTGNIERGARIKLARGRLNDHFDFGGFGCDAEERAEVIATGARRGAGRLGVAMEACRVLVIGDTARDVAAAQAIGAECLAVATGGTSLDELSACGATYCVADLTAPEVAGILGG